MLVIGAAAVWGFTRRDDPWPGTWPAAPSASGEPATPDAPRLIRALGLSDADDHALLVLRDEGGEILVVYPAGVDPIETAARWSLAIGGTGFRKVEEASRPGRTVVRFSREDRSLVLAVGATVEGPFVSVSVPARAHHWSLLPDASAPPALRALLPPPKPDAAPVETAP